MKKLKNIKFLWLLLFSTFFITSFKTEVNNLYNKNIEDVENLDIFYNYDNFENDPNEKYKYPYSIVFVGIDNEIDQSGTDRITMMVVREMKKDLRFSLTNAVYHKSSDTTDRAYWTSGNPNDLVASQSITYTGDPALPPGTIICGDLPGEGLGEALLFNNITINGQPADNLFNVENDGLSPNPNLNMETDRWGNLYIYQGFFFDDRSATYMLGSVIDGIAMGISNSDLIEQGIPQELGSNIEMSLVENTGSTYIFVLCDGVLYLCEIPFILKDPRNWNRFNGTELNDLTLEELCEMLCGVSDCPGVVEVSVEEGGQGGPTQVCDYVICNMPFYGGYIDDIEVKLPNGDNISLTVEPEFSFNYYYPASSGQSSIADLASHINNWLTANGYLGNAYMTSSYPNYPYGSCRGMGDNNFLVIEDTNVEFVIAEGIGDNPVSPEEWTYFYRHNCGPIANESEYVLTATIDNCDDPEFLWSTGETTQSIIVSEPGIYTVTITCADDCEYEGEIKINPPQGNLEPRDQTSNNEYILTVYPNPANDLITIGINIIEKGEYIFDISDITGKKVKTNSIILRPGSNKLTVDISNIPSGLYNVIVRNNSEYKTSKFSKID